MPRLASYCWRRSRPILATSGLVRSFSCTSSRLCCSVISLNWRSESTGLITEYGRSSKKWQACNPSTSTMEKRPHRASESSAMCRFTSEASHDWEPLRPQRSASRPSVEGARTSTHGSRYSKACLEEAARDIAARDVWTRAAVYASSSATEAAESVAPRRFAAAFFVRLALGGGVQAARSA